MHQKSEEAKILFVKYLHLNLHWYTLYNLFSVNFVEFEIDHIFSGFVTSLKGRQGSAKQGSFKAI